MVLTGKQIDAMTDAELKAVIESRSWDIAGYSMSDRQSAEIELTWRITNRMRRGVEIGETIEFVRYGAIPATGLSRNHRENISENGISVYMFDKVKKEVVHVGFHFDISSRPAYRGTGVVVGWGSDGEPLVQVSKIHRDKKFDR